MSLLLLFTGSAAPPAGDPQQHLLLALQWTPDVTPPPSDPQQHLLLALMWTPGDVVVPPVEPPVTPPADPLAMGPGWGDEGVYPRRRPRPNDDDEVLAIILTFLEVDAWR
jgi:hypothetical protein